MSPYEVDLFIHLRKISKREIITKTILGGLSLGCLIFFALNNMTYSQPIFAVMALMVSVTLWLVAIMCLIDGLTHRAIIQRKKMRLQFLQRMVNYTRDNDDYESINHLLAKDEAAYYIMELGFLMTEHFNGSWVNQEKIQFQDAWGDSFFDKMKEFFSNNRPDDVQRITDLDTMTFLATVNIEQCEELLEGIELAEEEAAKKPINKFIKAMDRIVNAINSKMFFK